MSSSRVAGDGKGIFFGAIELAVLLSDLLLH